MRRIASDELCSLAFASHASGTGAFPVPTFARPDPAGGIIDRAHARLE
jgi:hypothetical protein